jgi:hypothetical protein
MLSIRCVAVIAAVLLIVSAAMAGAGLTVISNPGLSAAAEAPAQSTRGAFPVINIPRSPDKPDRPAVAPIPPPVVSVATPPPPTVPVVTAAEVLPSGVEYRTFRYCRNGRCFEERRKVYTTLAAARSAGYWNTCCANGTCSNPMNARGVQLTRRR